MEYKSRYYRPDEPVSVVPLGEYSEKEARAALEALLSPLGVLDEVKAGMCIVIKANLVSAMKPEEAATTHPVLLSALCDMLSERGAEVVIGDSPGGLYNAAFVGRVYTVAGIRECEKHDARLNDDFSEKHAEYPEGKYIEENVWIDYLGTPWYREAGGYAFVNDAVYYFQLGNGDNNYPVIDSLALKLYNEESARWVASDVLYILKNPTAIDDLNAQIEALYAQMNELPRGEEMDAVYNQIQGQKKNR